MCFSFPRSPSVPFIVFESVMYFFPCLDSQFYYLYSIWGCEKVAAWRPSQVAVSQTGVHLLICDLWSSEVVKRVRHNLPNQSKLLEGEHAKRFMKPLSSPGSWGMICQSSPSFFQATCLSLILWVVSSEISVTSFLIWDNSSAKHLHPEWSLMMEAIDVWHPIYAWLDINWKKYMFRFFFQNGLFCQFLLYEIVPLKNMYVQ